MGITVNGETECIVDGTENELNVSWFDGKWKLNTIKVDKDNMCYTTVDGILYSRDMTTLVKAPEGLAIKELVIPDTVKTIGYKAFYGNRSLESVIFPSGLEEMGACAFTNARQLRAVDFTGCRLTTVPKCGFSNCRSLENIVLSERIEEIGESAFSGCRLIKRVGFPEGLKVLGHFAFSGCDISRVILPRSLQEVGFLTFKKCRGLVMDVFTGIERIDRVTDVETLVNVLEASDGQPVFSMWFPSSRSWKYYEELWTSWQPGARMDYTIMDNVFKLITDPSYKVKAALARLQYHIDLSPEMEERYREYISGNAIKYCIDTENLELAGICEKYDAINRENVDELIEYADRKKMVAFVAYLMDHKNRKITGSDEELMDLFDLGEL